ncbi:MarR family transcriptional regulator [Motilibacter rhizosphaerae]|uniref:MarR family transcriptional regulator n=1 Tax=Motilibacter rhizosphaerae TaxID=598652 RepID=A0A4Q7NQD7_9ACTN|nr:MarR family transcriptional regulator [Motilibacter rhizosphaerae]RZS87509.1 MarR family transcriptional regulator [Motilibacter rhizosphaerae]
METDDLSLQLRPAVMRLARRLRNARESDLPVGKLMALASLDRHGPMTPGELAEHEHVSPPSMTRTIAALEEQGLLTRSPHPTDRRQQILAVTPDAHAMLEADRKRRDALLTEALADLTRDERAVLAAAVPVLAKLAGG